MTRLMLVDDHQVVRAGLRALLSQVPSLEVVGEAGSVAEALTVAIDCRPEVILMDLRLPDGSGVEACREILSAMPATRILFLTSHSDDEAVMSTVLSGAAGYLLKDIRAEALIRAIGDAAAGRPVLDSKLAQPVLMDLQTAVREEEGLQGGVEALAPQERRILALVVEGKTNKEIARASAASILSSTTRIFLLPRPIALVSCAKYCVMRQA